jgi:hypothetical protein
MLRFHSFFHYLSSINYCFRFPWTQVSFVYCKVRVIRGTTYNNTVVGCQCWLPVRALKLRNWKEPLIVVIYPKKAFPYFGCPSSPCMRNDRCGVRGLGPGVDSPLLLRHRSHLTMNTFPIFDEYNAKRLGISFPFCHVRISKTKKGNSTMIRRSSTPSP